MLGHVTVQSVAVGALAAGAAVTYYAAAKSTSACSGFVPVRTAGLRRAIAERVKRAAAARGGADITYPRLSRYGVSAIAVVTAILTLGGVLAPVIAYSVLCLSMVAVFAADLVAEEGARRVRTASLAPRRLSDALPALWALVAVASTLLLFPYVVNAPTRIEALIVGTSVLGMAAIAWRIASAPTQYGGDDLAVERIVDGGTRATRAGLASVLATGAVFVFASFASVELPGDGGEAMVVTMASFVVWAALWVWSTFYVRHLFRSLDAIAR